MGIRGLSTFIDIYDQGEFFAQTKLANTKLIIDGNNLRFQLFRSCRSTNSIFGGDYLTYRKHVQDFIQSLLSCDISPVVVMDGAYDKSEMKLRTTIKRAREQTYNATKASLDKVNRTTVMPLFAKDVFVDVCRSNSKVTLIQTNFEADPYLAKLGTLESCPLLSNDSDFFVYNVNFVKLDSLDTIVRTDEKGVNYLSCQMFNKSKFMSYYGMTEPRLLHLMSSVLGNDYVNMNAFERFFCQMKQPKRRKNLKPRHRIMMGLLGWLGREKNIDGAIEKIMSTIPKDERPALKKKLDTSMEMYKQESEATEESVNFHISGDTMSPGCALPEWFINDFRRGHFPTWFLDVVVNQVFFLPCQVEDNKAIGSHVYTQPLLKKTIGFLLSLLKCEETSKTVKLYCRIQGFSQKAYYQDVDIHRDSLLHMREKSVAEKENFILDTLNVENTLRQEIQSVSNCLKTILIGITYWTSNCNVSLLELKTFAFCLFMQDLLNGLNIFKLGATSDDVLTKLRDKMSRFFVVHRDLKAGSSKHFHLDFVKNLSNLQSILYHLSKMCRLIALDTFDIDITDFWIGTFFFNIHHDLESFRDENRIPALLNFDEEMIAKFQEVLEMVLRFAPKTVPTVFRGKRARKKVKKDKKDSMDDMDNKFSILCIDDESE